nr:MAG TPA: hypothetical protein [Caudoviricetes sp.]
MQRTEYRWVYPSLILSLKIVKHLYDIEIRVATV